MNLHSTMVSINLAYSIIFNIYSVIYIPLWYLLIAERQENMCFVIRNLHSTMVSINPNTKGKLTSKETNLHSTMVSINLFRSLIGKTSNHIYIPLWYLLIVEKPTRNCLNRSYLHSTMVSINRH